MVMTMTPVQVPNPDPSIYSRLIPLNVKASSPAPSIPSVFLKLRFITESDLISDGIRVLTRGYYSHVEIILSDGSYLGAHDSGGVMIRPWNYTVPTRERRYAVPVFTDQLAQMLDFAHSQVGKPYDKLDILGLVLEKDLQKAGDWICSELVTAIMQAGGLFPLNALPDRTNLVTPELLHLSPYFLGNCYYEKV